MAVRLKKYPKKPKATASVETMKRWLERCKQVDKDNAPKLKAIRDKKALRSKIIKTKQKRA